jgi:hypothetical protein
MTTQKKRLPLPQKRKKLAKLEKDPEFFWYSPCLEFLKNSGALSITSVDDPHIGFIDTFLKMTMDGLSKHNSDLIEEANGSVMFLLLIVIDQTITDGGFVNSLMRLYFLAVLKQRMEENILLRDQYKSTDPKIKQAAAAKLRTRGLLK